MALGVQNVKYVYAQDIVADPAYWELVIKVAKNATLARIRRAMDIMGRQAENVKDLAKYLYPAMQVADMLYLGVDLAYGGMDQRHAHMLCRDVASKIGKKKPVALHTPLLSSLQKGGRMDMVQVGRKKTENSVVVQVVKMSKSKPGSSIFIHDDPTAISKKLRGAYCPEGIVKENPVLEILQHLIFPNISQPLVIDRKKEHGGPLHYAHYGKLEEDYLQKKIHPLDLKNTVAAYLIDILEPVRDYFTHHPQNLQKIQQFLQGGK
jgi:tyrosyl-tRNA synthetase